MQKISFLGLAALLMITSFGVGCQNKKGPATATSLKRIHFDFNSAGIRSDMSRILDANARYLKKHKNTKIIVAGHCDERGTNEYNLALGDRRAKIVRTYLVRKGVNGNRMRTVSYGEERPLDPGHNEAAWYMNRRAEFERQ